MSEMYEWERVPGSDFAGRLDEIARNMDDDDVGPSGGCVQKVCGGCGRPVDDSSEVGKLYYCEWVLRSVPVKIKRTPLWKSVGAGASESTPRGPTDQRQDGT